MTETGKFFAVDRREGEFLVLVDEEGASLDVRSKDLPQDCRHEGAVIRVPSDNRGNHLWTSAVRDMEQEKNREKDTEAKLRRLRKSDSGGDISL